MYVERDKEMEHKDESGYLRKSMGLLQKGGWLVLKDRKEGMREKESGIFIFMSLLVSVVIDGYPLTEHQMNFLEDRSITPLVILELDVPSKEIFKRLFLEKKTQQR